MLDHGHIVGNKDKGQVEFLLDIRQKVQHLRTIRTEDNFARLEKLVTVADKAIQTGIFLPNETSYGCVDCPYAGACSQWHCANSRMTSISNPTVQPNPQNQYQEAA